MGDRYETGAAASCPGMQLPPRRAARVAAICMLACFATTAWPSAAAVAAASHWTGVQSGPSAQPDAREYSVRANDTLWGIAQRTNSTVRLIARANHITPPWIILPGEHLHVPRTGALESPDSPVPLHQIPVAHKGNARSEALPMLGGWPKPSWPNMTTVFLSIAALSVTGILVALGMTTLRGMLYAWARPGRLEQARQHGTPDIPSRASVAQPRRYSLIVPARHEEKVLGATLAGLAALEYADYEILAVIGHDDPGTRAVAEAAAARHPDKIRIIIDHNWPKNKPKALNAALPHCTGEVVGVFDAEDVVARDLLNAIEAQFHAASADIVQGGVHLVNFWSSWWTPHNVLEYYFWFRSRLLWHAGQQFIPLGGNTVFINRERLTRAGGWDESCLAEDCELGVRLSVAGAVTAVAYDPDLVTREETPVSLSALLRQRTRWSQGYLQVLRKQDWRDLHSRRERARAWYILAQPVLYAFTGLAIPLSIASFILLNLPVAVVLVTFIPAILVLITAAIQMAGLHEVSRGSPRRVRLLGFARLAIGLPFYQALLAYPAVRAVTRELKGRREWEKTAHTGAHLQGPAVQEAGS